MRNAKKYGVKVLVAVNKFFTDTAAEIEMVKAAAIEAGADAAVSGQPGLSGAGSKGVGLTCRPSAR